MNGDRQSCNQRYVFSDVSHGLAASHQTIVLISLVVSNFILFKMWYLSYKPKIAVVITLGLSKAVKSLVIDIAIVEWYREFPNETKITNHYKMQTTNFANFSPLKFNTIKLPVVSEQLLGNALQAIMKSWDPNFFIQINSVSVRHWH